MKEDVRMVALKLDTATELINLSLKSVTLPFLPSFPPSLPFSHTLPSYSVFLSIHPSIHFHSFRFTFYTALSLPQFDAVPFQSFFMSLSENLQTTHLKNDKQGSKVSPTLPSFLPLSLSRSSVE